ncbi:MAG: hypothetical protein A3E87_01180 [Gammaproteobacteria bacterium RIFCSPHIGHO2_12_FULL_35_23]|nr:MAG: hypothetical protein A3E87_01180 [Gammaproteobacteria bacterium RIFCSPHIGHO2_12_FULL_35_23]
MRNNQFSSKISLVIYSSIMSLLLLLSACARQSPSSAVVRSIGVNNYKPRVVKTTKFTLGPNQGLLGIRHYYFDCQSTLMPSQYQNAAKAQASYLKNTPSARLQLQGYAAAGGGEGYNIAIADQRARSVANYLQLQGVNPEQISIVSYGSLKAKPFNGQVIAKNCRVDLVYREI